MKPLITNIQRFSLHDGPEIRTTVFFKGCSLHCPWCANPENINRKEEIYFIPEKCNPRWGRWLLFIVPGNRSNFTCLEEKNKIGRAHV